MSIVLAGVLKRVLRGSDKKYPCPFRIKGCKGHVFELHDDNGRPKRHYSGWMPYVDGSGKQRLTDDTRPDVLDQKDFWCDYCLSPLLGTSIRKVSDWKPPAQEIEVWKKTRESRVMELMPKTFTLEEIAVKKAKETGNR